MNIVPFIDLMSCLTAFLLVTAVWSEIARITIQPKGKARSNEPPPDVIEPKISILLQPDTIYIGVSSAPIDPVVAKKENGEYEWGKIEGAIVALRKEPIFDGKKDIEIAAESTTQHPVFYKDIIHAMDLAAKNGFEGVGLSEPSSLSWRPSL
ncbi:MAG: biopolymer transporter ExbD [Myxococcales bacterium]|nr:biopolymer transporter ExbD [Myxococcales bacterium]